MFHVKQAPLKTRIYEKISMGLGSSKRLLHQVDDGEQYFVKVEAVRKKPGEKQKTNKKSF